MKASAILPVCLGLVLAGPALAQHSFDTTGFLALRGGWVEGPSAWIEGGFGRFQVGAEGPGNSTGWARGEGQLGIQWEHGASWTGHLHLMGRAEDSDARGRQLGFTEAWVQHQTAVGQRSELFTRAGLFFYPSSMENSDPLWGSPYTLSYSAINSWIGEEFRPLGIDLRWRHFARSDHIYSVAATVFGGNDTMGTLLAWRGWTLHDRLSVFDEPLPLPPVFSLEPDEVFGAQRPFTSTAFGSDLDGRPGWALRARISKARDYQAQLAWVDNRGDRGLHGDEYAWHTRFWLAGASWQASPQIELLGELTSGTTTMNYPGMPWVDADFDAAYLMASTQTGHGRWSLRYDRFRLEDRLQVADWGLFDDSGYAWTLAWIHSLSDRSRLAAELVWLSADRPVAAQSGFAKDASGSMLSLEWRWRF